MTANRVELVDRIQRFESDAHRLFARHEGVGPSRVVELEQTYEDLKVLNLPRQDDLFRQALRCAENGLYRAAHVMCWAAVMDYIQEILERKGMPAILIAYPKWQATSLVAELAEYIPEVQLVGALQKLGIATKNQVKALQSLLNRRNECAHPSLYLPGLNETLGYISEVLNRAKQL